MSDWTAIDWQGDALALLDQRVLPERIAYLRFENATEVAGAIRDMVVRGAPAIGITAAYGVVLAAREAQVAKDPRAFMKAALAQLAASRPTAVNLFWALERMQPLVDCFLDNTDAMDALSPLDAEARRIHEEDEAANRRMGQFGADLIAAGGRKDLITHCNTGSLATGGYGTALGVIRAASARGLVDTVYAGETRPWLQGARLTAWELQLDAIPSRLMADSAAAHIMASRSVGWVVVGADRIAANGDTANKIGTYSLAVLARHHGVRFMVAAPASTIDFSLRSGQQIPIEERDGAELTTFRGQAVAPAAMQAVNPVFDVTPADLIDAIVTERGVVERPSIERMQALNGRP